MKPLILALTFLAACTQAKAPSTSAIEPPGLEVSIASSDTFTLRALTLTGTGPSESVVFNPHQSETAYAIVNGELIAVGVDRFERLSRANMGKIISVVPVGSDRIVLSVPSALARPYKSAFEGETGAYFFEEKAYSALRPLGSGAMCSVRDGARMRRAAAIVEACLTSIKVQSYDLVDNRAHQARTIADFSESRNPQLGVYIPAWQIENIDDGWLVVGPAPVAACALGILAIRLDRALEVMGRNEFCLIESPSQRAELEFLRLLRGKSDALTITGLASLSANSVDAEASLKSSIVFTGKIENRNAETLGISFDSKELSLGEWRAKSVGQFNDELVVLAGRRNTSNSSAIWTDWDCATEGARSEVSSDFRSDIAIFGINGNKMAQFDAGAQSPLEDLYNTMEWRFDQLSDGTPVFWIQSFPHRDNSCAPVGMHRLLLLTAAKST
jgi:hypothetical protein